jgi:hypothetical protein
MKTRCNNPNFVGHKDYGGRGITYCDRWEDFVSFFEDMGERPEGTSLDRIDNNGNYEPGNCRWATQVVQHNNKRSNQRITVNGFTRTAAHWARLLGVDRHVVLERLKLGWPEELAVTTPLHGRKRAGRKHGRAILNKHEVALIKKFLFRHPPPCNQHGVHAGGYEFLSRFFGVSIRAIRKINSGQTWSDVIA